MNAWWVFVGCSALSCDTSQPSGSVVNVPFSISMAAKGSTSSTVAAGLFEWTNAARSAAISAARITASVYRRMFAVRRRHGVSSDSPRCCPGRVARNQCRTREASIRSAVHESNM